MSAKPSAHCFGSSRKFVPLVNPLEQRILLASLRLGNAVQSGTLLSVTVNRPSTNTVQVTDDGHGDVQVEWNGGPVHSFTGVTTTDVNAQRATNDQITFHLTGSPAAVAILHGPTDALSGHTSGRSLRVPALLKEGSAVQSGSILTVTVTKLTTNAVEIGNLGAGNVQVEWNGGPAHSFAGVETIVVDAKNARKDTVALDDATA